MINVAPGRSEGRSWRTWPPAVMANKAERCMGLLRIHTKAERRRPLVFSLTNAHTLLLSSPTMSKHLHIAGYRRGIPAVIAGIPSTHASRRTPYQPLTFHDGVRTRGDDASANAANVLRVPVCCTRCVSSGCTRMQRHQEKRSLFLWRF